MACGINANHIAMPGCMAVAAASQVATQMAKILTRPYWGNDSSVA